jgi:Fe-S cluster assembly protein SufD
MLPEWPTSKVEAYKYTDLSKVGALALPIGEITWQGQWPSLLKDNTNIIATYPAVRAASQHKVVVPRGTEVALIETLHSATAGVGVAHQQLTIELEAGARLTHIRRQAIDKGAFHWGQTTVRLARDAHYQQVVLTTGAALARHELTVELNEAGAEFELLALQLLGAGQHGDITTTVRHNAPHTRSNQLIKNVLTADARGVYQGGIRVAPVAQKTDGQQQSRALLLSPQAEMNTKPELEIFADDVSCSHGAATGALDEAQLFYLQSRGVPLAQARALLISGFAADVFAGVKQAELRAPLEQEAATWLQQL